jgi:hypothetical protein
LVRQLLPMMFVPLRKLFAEFAQGEQRQMIEQLKHLSVNLAEAHKNLTERFR